MISYLEDADKNTSVEPLYHLAKSLSTTRPILAHFFANLVKKQTTDSELKQKLLQIHYLFAHFLMMKYFYLA